MGDIKSLPANVYFFTVLSCFAVLPTGGTPIYPTQHLKSVSSNDYRSSEKFSESNCTLQEYELKDVVIFENKDLFLKPKNLTILSTNYRKEGQRILISPCFANVGLDKTLLNCPDGKIAFDSSEYKILPNGSVDLFGDIILKQDYEINGTVILICAVYYDGGGHFISEWTLRDISILVGQIGSGISIAALSFYLIIFAYLPTLRNLPGYNLASLSTAFLLGYSFWLIGQIKEVLGISCVISAILNQYFFLTAFFCMNVLAFDVWRTMKLATEKLVIGSQNTRKRQFLWYSLYAWGCPLLISAISVVFDHTKGIPDILRPYYGKGNICWLASKYAKTLFFSAPAFIILVINVYFFIRSFYMISNNTLKCTNDQTKQTTKLNYVLYVRLALMMGLTWLIGIIGWISEDMIVWFIFDIVNSLQGLFLFLLFTCTKKVIRNLKAKASSIRNSTERNTTYCSDSNSKQSCAL